MNKLKEQLKLKMLGQLSDEKTEIDVNNAYDVAVDFSMSLISFIGRNFQPLGHDGSNYKEIISMDIYSKEALLNKFLEEYNSNILIMTNRLETEKENFLYEIDREWKLSLNEKEKLDKLLTKIQKREVL